MPASDNSLERFFVWTISCVLFISIAAGGGCLVTYMVLPPDSAKPWLPVAGVTLVCLPWVFWFLMCFYRAASRAFGFRVILGGFSSDPGAPTRSTGNAISSEPNKNQESPMDDNGLNAAVLMVGDPQGGGGGGEKKNNAINRNLSASSGNDSSIRSHESEMPLTYAMAS